MESRLDQDVPKNSAVFTTTPILTAHAHRICYKKVLPS